MTTESDPKGVLAETLRKQLKGFIIFRHEDRFRFGVPDFSIVGLGITSWWEGKHANPDFESKSIQELTMLRLAAASYARYIIWEEIRGIKRTLIVHPRSMGDWSTKHEASTMGFNHRWVADFIRKVHTP